ncbi:MAG: YegP family protein [Flavobacteriaceae bacterium]
MKNPKFTITTKNNQSHFVLKAKNGEVILSSEMYNSKQACENGIESVKEYSQEFKCFDTKISNDNKPYFVLKAANGEVIGVSETYNTQKAMLKGADSVAKNAPIAQIEHINIDPINNQEEE